MSNGGEWRPVVGFEETYEVSILEIRRISTGRILKPWFDRYGRPCVILCLCGKRRRFRVSHLVADAFLPPKSPTDQVLRHLNDDPTDNRPENLAWGTRSDNAQDSIRNGTFHDVKGTANGNAKLTEDQVREIRRLYATGEFSLQELALQFGLSKGEIWRIVRRKTWKHVL